MDNINQTFCTQRFGAYFKAYLASNRRTLLLSMLSIPVVFLIFGACLGYDADPRMAGDSFDYAWRAQSSLALIALYLFGAASASKFYSAMGSKEKRLSTMLVPASQLEKFLTYFILYIVAFYVVFYISFFIGDRFRVLCAHIFTPNGAYAESLPLRDIFIFLPFKSVLANTIIYSSVIAIQALFALGSILWMKNSFLKSLIAYFVISSVAGVLTLCSANIFFHNAFTVPRRLIPIHTESGAAWTVGIISAIITILLYWLTYRRSRETEIVSRW